MTRFGRSDAEPHLARRQEHLADKVLLMGSQRGRQKGLVQGQRLRTVLLQDRRLDVGLVQPPLRVAHGRQKAQLLLQSCGA